MVELKKSIGNVDFIIPEEIEEQALDAYLYESARGLYIRLKKGLEGRIADSEFVLLLIDLDKRIPIDFPGKVSQEVHLKAHSALQQFTTDRLRGIREVEQDNRLF